MKKVLLILIIAGVIFFSCGGGSGRNGGGKTEGKAPSIVLASFLNPGSPENVAMIWMSEQLGEKGLFKPEVYEGGTLGTENELLEQIKSGQTHITFGNAVPAYVRKYWISAVPFMISDEKVLEAIFGGKIGDAIKSAFGENNILISGHSLRGNRQLTANRIIESPKDLQGMKMRLPENPIYIEIWKEIGVLPTPVASPEVFSALQTGVVEAQENPISSNYQKGLWEVQKYTMMTNHLFDYFLWLVSKNWYDSLENEHRKVFDEIMVKGIKLATDITFEKEDACRVEMEQKGMKYIENIDFRAFQEKARPAIERVCRDFEPWVLEELQKILEKI
jgi:TRAP-type C4-dicarboxylate transport system substrate-binding protein